MKKRNGGERLSPLEGEMPEGQRGSAKAARRLHGANPPPTPSGLPPISPLRAENTHASTPVGPSDGHPKRERPARLALPGTDITAVALAAGAAALLVALPLTGDVAVYTTAPLVLAALAWIALEDFRTWTIPDGAVAALGLLGAAWRLAAGENALWIALDGIAWGGVFLGVREIYFRRRGIDGLGFGDVKLAFAGGVLNGTAGFTWALLLASLAGLGATAVAAARGKRLEKIPFGAFLAPACGVIWFLGLQG